MLTIRERGGKMEKDNLKKTIVSLRGKSFTEWQNGNKHESVMLAKQALEYTKLFQSFCDDPNEGMSQLASSYYDLALSLSENEEHSEALLCINQAIDIRIHLLRENPSQNTLIDLAISFRGRAKVYKRMNLIELATFDQKTRKEIEKLLGHEEKFEKAIVELLGDHELVNRLHV